MIFPFENRAGHLIRYTKAFGTCIALLLFWSSVDAQSLAGLSTKWDDSFNEWIVYTTDAELVGEIVMRWPLRNDWSEWDYRIGELSGSIRIKWKDDPNLWELRGGSEIVTIRTVFQDDFRQWEVKTSGFTVDVKSKWANILEEWYVEGSRSGKFDMFTAWEGDLRDWVVEDQLDPAISIHVKLGLVFIPILYTTPKF